MTNNSARYDGSLTAILDSQPHIVYPTLAQGASLVCFVPGCAYRRLVCEYQVPDKEMFWAAWRAVGGENQMLVWEDGSRFIVPFTKQPDDPGPSWITRLMRFLFPWFNKESDDV